MYLVIYLQFKEVEEPLQRMIQPSWDVICFYLSYFTDVDL